MLQLSKLLTVALAACCVLPLVSAKAKRRYDPNWDSLDSRPLPEWYDDAKFGIFIHWGVYSVPAWQPVGQYAEWYWDRLRNVDDGGVTAAFHNATYGPNFRYQDFAPMFKAELFNATEWAELFRRSGARYTVPTSKHHEGFAIWPSDQAWNWNSVDIGPHRDLLGEIMQATREAGLHAGMYFSLFEWFHPFMSNITKYVRLDSHSPNSVDEIMYPQWMDLIDNYAPEVLWLDGDWVANSSTWRTPELVAYAFNDGPTADTIVVDDRLGTDTNRKHGSFYTPEYDATVYDNKKWEASMGIDIHSYGFNRATPSDKYYTAQYLLNVLVRCVSNGGNLLLDIGPHADGTIPTIMQDRLLEMGAWLDVNGEAIYGTRPWRVHQEGDLDNTTVRYTASKLDEVFYAHVLSWPDNGLVTLSHPNVTDDSVVTMLGSSNELMFKPLRGGADRNQGLVVQLPTYNPSTAVSNYIWVLRLVNFS